MCRLRRPRTRKRRLGFWWRGRFHRRKLLEASPIFVSRFSGARDTIWGASPARPPEASPIFVGRFSGGVETRLVMGAFGASGPGRPRFLLGRFWGGNTGVLAAGRGVSRRRAKKGVKRVTLSVNGEKGEKRLHHHAVPSWSPTPVLSRPKTIGFAIRNEIRQIACCMNVT